MFDNVITCNAIPSLSALFGGDNGRLVGMINQQLASTGGGTVFAQYSDPIVNMHTNKFYQQILYPEIEMGGLLEATIGNFRLGPMRVIDSIEELEKGIPPSMHMAIMTMPSMRELFERGLIQGFGIPLTDFPDHDQWGRLISNGHFTFPDVITPEVIADDSQWQYSWTFYGDDPNYTLDELSAVKQTRSWLEKFITNTKYDPTMYPNKRREES
jgi:hypothetical protein